MRSLRDSIDWFRSRVGPGPRSFLAWWLGALASWLPSRWRVLLGLTQDRLLIQRLDQELHLRWQEGDQLRDVAQIPAPVTSEELQTLLSRRLAELPRWLLLPTESVLHRRLLLPAAAAERLRDVVRFELDRQTPFTPNEVCFDARILERREDGQLETELVVAPRARFDMALQALEPLSADLVGVDVVGADGQPMGVNLLPSESRRTGRAPHRGLHWGLASVAVLALMFAGWLTLENRRAAADAFEAKMESRSAEARRVSAKRQQLVELTRGVITLDQTRASRPTTVEVLDEVTRRLPDNTYLEKLSIEGQRLLLIGLSPEASGLVARLQDSPLWRNPALSGALQPDARSRLDRFTLTAELTGTAAAAAPAPPAPAAAAGDARGAGDR
jgi:general secretion pathway protein L